LNPNFFRNISGVAPPMDFCDTLMIMIIMVCGSGDDHSQYLLKILCELIIHHIADQLLTSGQ